MEPLRDCPWTRRQVLTLGGLTTISWFSAVSELMADNPLLAGETRWTPAESMIFLWLAGGPSQLETFDPHPGTSIAAGTTAIATAVQGVQLASGLPRLAEEMASVALIRSMVSKEGDHERGTYTLKTGFRPDPTVVHPSLGAILCQQRPAEKTEIPRHISILAGQWPGRGGYLGEQYNAFLTGDPRNPVPDLESPLPPDRDRQRLADLEVVERVFARGRQPLVEGTLHQKLMQDARRTMTSPQRKAFDISSEPLALRRSYGETPFGRACLAARRLIEVGVRCVEVTLAGWDTHANNHAQVARLVEQLDPAFSTLIRDLRERGRLDSTLVVCGGEFGRTPTINPAGGRDHWPTGFSFALAGGPVRGGTVLGSTDPEGKAKPTHPVSVEDLQATLLTAVGVSTRKLHQTPIGRTVKVSEGKPLEKVLKPPR